MSDPLIDKLTGNLKPVRPLNMRPVIALGVLAGFLVFVYIYYSIGLRPEVIAIFAGVLSDQPMVYIKPMVYLTVALCAFFGMYHLYRPEGRFSSKVLIPIGIMSGLLLAFFVAEMINSGFSEALLRLSGGEWVCFRTVLIGGILSYVGLWGLWLRKAATTQPMVLGALSGLFCASLMACVYALHCNMDSPGYVLLVYGGAVAFTSLVTAFLGKWSLKW
jgi:hypothetical protein